jgi:hypothetical protein
MYYIKYFDMFRAILCSSSGGQNCIFTASGIVTLCERPYSAPVESELIQEVKTLFLQHLVSSLSISGRTVRRLRAEDEPSIVRNMSRNLM